MSKKPILVIDKPKFIVKLHEDILEVDLKEGAKKEFEDVIESDPLLKKSLGFVFQTVIPSDISLSAIDTVKVDEKGQLRIVVSRRRDIVIPLEPEESQKLAEKLNELIPLAKTRKEARKRRLSLHLWWPDFYSHVVASGL